jgi:MFS family permease
LSVSRRKETEQTEELSSSSPSSFLLASALLASAPVQRLSDKWGRKPMLVILPIIDALALVVLLLACKYLLASLASFSIPC